jgi:hypothetical protein
MSVLLVVLSVTTGADTAPPVSVGMDESDSRSDGRGMAWAEHLLLADGGLLSDSWSANGERARAGGGQPGLRK